MKKTNLKDIRVNIVPKLDTSECDEAIKKVTQLNEWLDKADESLNKAKGIIESLSVSDINIKIHCETHKDKH